MYIYIHTRVVDAVFIIMRPTFSSLYFFSSFLPNALTEEINLPDLKCVYIRAWTRVEDLCLSFRKESDDLKAGERERVRVSLQKREN